MHIGIDARLIDNKWGGVQQFVIGLAGGLSTLENSGARYTFLMYRNHTEWLEPFVSGQCTIQEIEDSPFYPEANPKRAILRSRFPFLRHALHEFYFYTKQPPSIMSVDNKIAHLGLDLVHFTYQNAELTSLPNIYHPWDLQHRHLKRLFTRYEKKVRDYLYQAFCRQADVVSVASEWGKDDLVKQYNIPADRVVVTPMASILDLYLAPSSVDLERIAQFYRLPERFAFFPSKTWPHKNHLFLLDVLATLRDHYDLTIPCVFSGGNHSHQMTINKRIQSLKLHDQIHHVGYVDTLTLRGIYQLATMLVFPSEFEGWGLPVTEAMSAGLPIICSDVTSLPQQVDDVGILLSPYNKDAWVDAIYQLWTNETLRIELRQKSLQRARLYSWEKVAADFYKQYRTILTN